MQLALEVRRDHSRSVQVIMSHPGKLCRLDCAMMVSYQCCVQALQTSDQRARFHLWCESCQSVSTSGQLETSPSLLEILPAQLKRNGHLTSRL